MKQKLLFICGIVAAVIYIGSDIIAAFTWPEYSYTAQSVSELRALGAPTRPMLLPVLFFYAIFELAFGYGVRRTPGERASFKYTGILLIILGIVDLIALFFPMHLRGDIHAAEDTLTDIMHIIITVLTVLLILLSIGFGSGADGKRFRMYSFITILVLFFAGIWSFMDAPKIGANLPTPWLGVRERITIYSYMIWLIGLALTLLKKEKHAKELNVIPLQNS